LGEAVLLMRMVHGQPVCIHRVETPSRFRLSFEPGQPLPLLRGASVRLLLGSLTAAEREAYLESALASGAQPPVHGREQFLRDIAQDSDRGWAISDEEIDEGVWAATAAVHEDGRVIAALSAPCPAFRLDNERKNLILDLVRKAAADVSNALSPA
jgi:DNA-binding IclR family transcriptional regulator